MHGVGFTKGLITGTLMAAILSMIVNPMDRRSRKRIKRGTTRFMRKAGDMFEGLADIRK